jgi:hypothetical protein
MVSLNTRWLGTHTGQQKLADGVSSVTNVSVFCLSNVSNVLGMSVMSIGAIGVFCLSNVPKVPSVLCVFNFGYPGL